MRLHTIQDCWTFKAIYIACLLQTRILPLSKKTGICYLVGLFHLQLLWLCWGTSEQCPPLLAEEICYQMPEEAASLRAVGLSSGLCWSRSNLSAKACMQREKKQQPLSNHFTSAINIIKLLTSSIYPTFPTTHKHTHTPELCNTASRSQDGSPLLTAATTFIPVKGLTIHFHYFSRENLQWKHWLTKAFSLPECHSASEKSVLFSLHLWDFRLNSWA